MSHLTIGLIWFVASLCIIAGFMCVIHSAPRDDEP